MRRSSASFAIFCLCLFLSGCLASESPGEPEEEHVWTATITPLIGVDDPELTHAVLDLVLRNGEWAGLVADLIANWLIQPEISAVQQKLLKKSLLALHTEPSIQHVISQLLARTDTSMETRVLLLEVIAASDMTELPEAWQEQLFASLHDAPHTVVEGALGVMAVVARTETMMAIVGLGWR